MNNIPSDKKYRAAFTAQDPDYRIISADFSGQELRLLAHITQEPKFLDALEKGIDLHTNSASLIFNKPYDSITKDQRTAAKSLTFGLIYGIGPMKLSANLDIDIRQAKYLMNRYFTTFPYIKKTLDVLVAEAKKNKYAYSPLDKRRRDLATFDWDNSREVAHAVNIAKNLPFQGAGASVTKYALCALSNKIHKKDLDAQIINVIHDEILVEVHKDDADETAKVVESEMIAAFNHFAPSVPMVVDAAIDTCWLH
jgi:DNA polymerase-1